VLAGVVAVYRRWRTRRVAEIVVEHFAGFLFDLARTDGPENAAECACIADHVLIVGSAVVGRTLGRADSSWVGGIIWRAQQTPMTSAAKEAFLIYLGRSREMANQFLDLFAQLAAFDGEVNEPERQWLEAVYVLTVADPIGAGGRSDFRHAGHPGEVR
jgi:hypothetical protein